MHCYNTLFEQCSTTTMRGGHMNDFDMPMPTFCWTVVVGNPRYNDVSLNDNPRVIFSVIVDVRRVMMSHPVWGLWHPPTRRSRVWGCHNSTTRCDIHHESHIVTNRKNNPLVINFCDIVRDVITHRLMIEPIITGVTKALSQLSVIENSSRSHNKNHRGFVTIELICDQVSVTARWFWHNFFELWQRLRCTNCEFWSPICYDVMSHVTKHYTPQPAT